VNHHAALKTTRRRILASLLLLAAPMTALASTKSVYYITPGLDLPFWRTLGLGIGNIATQNGYQLKVLDSKNSDAQQLSNIEQAIREQAAGIVLSPTDSKSAQAVLELTSRARVPVVIADIGSNGGEFISYVKSDNYRGAFGVGQAVAAALKEKKLKDPAFALCTIALTRKNGQDRTNGFLDAMKKQAIPTWWHCGKCKLTPKKRPISSSKKFCVITRKSPRSLLKSISRRWAH
jgi:ABC-type sugar transport system substrate-binding protein